MTAPVAKKWLWYLTLVGAPLAFVSVLNLWFIAVADLDSAWLVKRADTIITAETSVESLPRNGRQIVLPNFNHSRKTVPPSIWYRMDVQVAQRQSVPWAIYVVGPASKYAVFVNGKFIGESGAVDVPMPQYVQPLIFRFPGDILKAGNNQVDLHSVSGQSRSLLQSVQFGPDAEVSKSFRMAHFALLTMKQIIVGGLIVMGIVMLVLSGSRARESVFGWYAIALFWMALHIGIRLLDSVPFGDPVLWKNAVDIALMGYIVCTAFFVNRYVNAAHTRFESWLLYWAVFGAAVLVLDPILFGSSVPWFFHRVWLPLTLPLWLYQTWLAMRTAKNTPNLESRVLAILCASGILIGGCDGLIGIVSLSSTVYLPYAMGPVLCIFWFSLIRIYVQAVNAAESARDQLELRVQEKTQELKETLGRVKDMEREQALSAERERIMRDMHDGVGAQLVQALSIAASKPELKSIEEPLRGCLEELRLIIDSIEPINGNLASVLGTLRMRMTRRLNEAAIQLRWRVDDIPTLADFGPNRVLHVSRIVQEAIANALKHSRAKQITLSAHMVAAESNAVVIEVADDGLGSSAPQSSGRGLHNMRRRAEELNARLSIDFGAHGTRVRLALPMDGPDSRVLHATQAPNLA